MSASQSLHPSSWQIQRYGAVPGSPAVHVAAPGGATTPAPVPALAPTPALPLAYAPVPAPAPDPDQRRWTTPLPKPTTHSVSLLMPPAGWWLLQLSVAPDAGVPGSRPWPPDEELLPETLFGRAASIGPPVPLGMEARCVAALGTWQEEAGLKVRPPGMRLQFVRATGQVPGRPQTKGCPCLPPASQPAFLSTSRLQASQRFCQPAARKAGAAPKAAANRLPADRTRRLRLEPGRSWRTSAWGGCQGLPWCHR